MNSDMHSCKTGVCFDSADSWEDVELDLKEEANKVDLAMLKP